MTHDQQKLANMNMCWPTFLGVLHDTRAGNVGQQMDNMADSDDEDALFAFLFLCHMSKDLDNLTHSGWILVTSSKYREV